MQAAPDASDEVGSALDLLHRSFGNGLLGVYLHGSAATAGGLRPHSDIDLLAVTAAPLSPRQRAGLAAELLPLSARHPARPGGPRCLELSVFCRDDLARGADPIRADFVYGEWLRDAFEQGPPPGPQSDPDHALILAQARQNSAALHGPPAEALLPHIPPMRVRRAMAGALPALVGGLAGDERNVLLTLARMWHTAETGAFASKDATAEWAIPRLPEPQARTLDLARRAYLGEARDDSTATDDDARSLAGDLHRAVTAALRPES